MMRRIGFVEKWIRSCLHNLTMSVLVNGNPTGDLKMQKGLKQGDHLSPFLFLMVVEGLVRIVQKVVRDGLFSSFQVNHSLNISLLQFADDIILVGNGSWDNIWCLKSIFRIFELVLGLKVNFHKSNIFV